MKERTDRQRPALLAEGEDGTVVRHGQPGVAGKHRVAMFLERPDEARTGTVAAAVRVPALYVG
jgi:hypothetical protein